MMNDNHKKSGCGFDEELVSYVYGETDVSSAAKFEAHLAGCAVCAGELEALSGVHFAIADWKEKEFAALETPPIEIPYPAVSKPEPANESWLPSFLRDVFAFSPRGVSLAAASLAILAVAFAAVLFMLKSNGGKDIAEANKNTEPVVAPTIEKTPNAANANQTNPPPTEQKAATERQSPAPEAVKQPATRNDRAVKATVTTPRATQKTENSPKNADVRRVDKNRRVPERSLPDDEEDETLRLAELFEEIDTKE